MSAYQDAWTSKDFAAARSYVADEVIFRSPQQHITGAEAFLSMLTAFAGQIASGWELLSATEDSDRVLILYNLFSPQRTVLPCADYFILRDAKIVSEMLVFDPRPFAALS